MLKLFRIVGFLEGLSYLLLLGVGMPLKYLAANPSAVEVLGMPHGILFVFYIVLAINVYIDLDWPARRVGQAVLASLLPFGTFVFDYKFLAHRAPKKD